ncbi:hypothetical protein HOF92_14785 [bacterium]|jgi:hypothetical protein|nr:hypothetical protein [bacterium]
MIIRFFILLFALLLLGFGCTQKKDSLHEFGVAQSLIGTDKVVFSYRDSRYDDRGTGKYVYPLSLRQRDGIFDLTHFQVRHLGKLIELSVGFRAPIEQEDLELIAQDDAQGKTNQSGWFFQYLDIYVDTNRKEGSGNTFSLPGRNIEFNRDEGWEKVIVLSPGPQREVRGYLSAQSEKDWLYKVRNDVLVPNNVWVRQYQLTARIAFSEFESPDPANWGYQVCVMGYNSANLTRNGMLNSEVVSHATETEFGGGSNHYGNPNIIDVLSPNKKSQYMVLSTHRSGPYAGDHILAILPMVYP